MNLEVKYRISLIIFLAGCILTVIGFFESQGSFGVAEIILSASLKLGFGFVLVAVGAPTLYYFKSLRSQKKSFEDIQTEMMAEALSADYKSKNKNRPQTKNTK